MESLATSRMFGVLNFSIGTPGKGEMAMLQIEELVADLDILVIEGHSEQELEPAMEGAPMPLGGHDPVCLDPSTCG